MNKLKRLARVIRDYYVIKNSDLFDPHYYLENNADVRHADLDPLKHYLRHGGIEGRNPSSKFDAKYYLKTYEDVRITLVNPLAHFILYGEKEGRGGITNNYDSISLPKPIEVLNNISVGGFSLLSSGLKNGEKKYDTNKELVVLVSHESSATGAPLLGYNIVDGLNKWYNVVHIVIKKANINDIIPKNCFLYVEDIADNPETKSTTILKILDKKYGIKAVILNSVETFPVLLMAGKLKLPTVSLIHEFSDYTRPVGKMVKTLFYATEVITPASIIKNSMLEELEMLTGIETKVNHVSQLPQGRLPYLPDEFGHEDTVIDLYKKLKISDPENTKIIVGSGYVQIRKGVDLFLAIARYVKQNYKGSCKFIWVGDGYNPQHDLTCSVWLKRDIKFYGLDENFIFLEHQKNLETVFSIADVFCLTSRMDPFPNVAIDAMAANLPIACFKDGSGTEEFVQQYQADYLLADYLDTHELAERIVQYFDSGIKKQTINAELVKKQLSFDLYMNSINVLINKAEKTTHATKASIQTILEHNMFDTNFYGLDRDPELAVYYYVSIYKKGLHKMSPNPLPGFSQLQWTLENGLNMDKTPLEQAIEKGVNHTHECKLVPFPKQEIKSVNFKYAVHLHLYYIDLAEKFKEYFKNLVGNYHLYITIINKEDIKTVYKAFEGCGATYIEVIVVENIGRDIGPMIFNLRKQLTSNDYKVLGHFHSKKSLTTDSNLGTRWREYLMQNLVGDNGIAESVLSLFSDPKVGLVFAEDKHIVDIGKNQTYVDDLSHKLELPKITNTPLFPLGNMFWARIDAIEQFFKLDPEELLQREPLPYDGSYMHAMERISPFLVHANGYKFITVYNTGTAW